MTKTMKVRHFFTEFDLKDLNEKQKLMLIENYETARKILIETKANDEWRYAKRKSIKDINNEPNFYLVSIENPLITLHIFQDEVFFDLDSSHNLLSKATITMLNEMQEACKNLYK